MPGYFWRGGGLGWAPKALVGRKGKPHVGGSGPLCCQCSQEGWVAGSEPERVAVGLGSQSTPQGTPLGILVPAVGGRSQPGQVRSLRRPRAGG